MNDSDRRHWLGYSMAGKGFILPLLVLMGVGYLLDRLTGLLPGFTVLGAVVGFFLGLYLLLRVERRLVEDQRRRQQQDRRLNPPSKPPES